MESMAYKLREKRGFYYTRVCRWTFGDGNCGFNNLSMGSGLVDTVVSRSEFVTDFLSGAAADHLDLGYIVWAPGTSNAGLTSYLKSYDASTGIVTLQIPTLNPIVVGDTHFFYRGCDGAKTTCKDHGRLSTFGGHSYLPGNDRLYTTPSSDA